MLASFFRVFVASPSMNNFIGAESSDMWVIEGCFSILLTKRWAKSKSGITFARLLGGENSRHTDTLYF
uniref:Uncharacterized protein n=1 Tax=Picea glauca TaxID=3330 RepID=A0A117NJ63_PICGL|nr:hypothetical protein ABT39_MTgene836 [Picea glauca]